MADPDVQTKTIVNNKFLDSKDLTGRRKIKINVNPDEFFIIL